MGSQSCGVTPVQLVAVNPEIEWAGGLEFQANPYRFSVPNKFNDPLNYKLTEPREKIQRHVGQFCPAELVHLHGAR